MYSKTKGVPEHAIAVHNYMKEPSRHLQPNTEWETRRFKIDALYPPCKLEQVIQSCIKTFSDNLYRSCKKNIIFFVPSELLLLLMLLTLLRHLAS